MHYYVTCHTTNGPPTIGLPGPSSAAMDGPSGLYIAATLGPGGPSTALSITTFGPPSYGAPTASPFTGVAAGSVAS